MKLKVCFESGKDGDYTAYVPSLPDYISGGDSIDEAAKNIKEAIELYLMPVEDDIIADEKVYVKEIAVWQKFQTCLSEQ
ncbi:MAG: type II toxin-antitoxin system HicB family antitoxin [Actinomycetota bacterium]